MTELTLDEIEQVDGGKKWAVAVAVIDAAIDFYQGFCVGFNGK
jgi:lactobin A/cerein 7B family class IIb bacteriocin